MRCALTLISLLAATALSLSSDTRPVELKAVDTGASKKEVRAALGAPTVRRGIVRNSRDQLVEVWEYWSGASGNEACWYYFVGDELVARREAGDWATEPDRIKASRFEPLA